MAEIIDLTASPRPEVIEISSDEGNTCIILPERAQGDNKRREKRGKVTSNSDGGSTRPSRVHSQEIGLKHSDLDDLPTSLPKPASQPLQSNASSTIDRSGLFFSDTTATPIPMGDISTIPERTESNSDENNLLLPLHVAIVQDDESIPTDVIPPPKPSSDNGEYIEYLDYDGRKAPELVRYFEFEGEDTSQPRQSRFKCKNCGAEGDHKTFECPIQICLTCGARDEHSTRSCPISKTCYACGMKGHINKTCPNRFTTYAASSDFHGDCDRCGSATHKMNECPTLWRIYQYVNEEEHILIMRSREEKTQLAIGEGGEGYIGKEVWCYNCANTSHLGDDCDELPHPTTFPADSSAFGSHNVMSGPFYDPAVEPVIIKRGPRERGAKEAWPRSSDDWDTGVPPADVGKLGKNKDKEKLEKRLREQEDEDDADDWFDDIRNTKKRGMDQKIPSSGPRGKVLKIGLIKNGGHKTSSSPPFPNSASGPSLLARLSGAGEGRKRGRGHEQHELSYQSENSLRIRGAASDQRNQHGRHAHSHKTDERRQGRWDRDGAEHGGGSRRGHGPRYKGGYNI